MVTFLQRNTYTHFIIMYYRILTKCSCKLFSKFDEMRNFTRPWCFQSFWWLNSFFRNQTAEICNVIFVHICLKSKKSAIWGGKINTIGFFFIAVLKLSPCFLSGGIFDEYNVDFLCTVFYIFIYCTVYIYHIMLQYLEQCTCIR